MKTPKKLVAGSEDYILYEIRNQTVVPAALYDPDTAVISIFKPDGTLSLADQPMTRESKGRYSFLLQTDIADMLGVWYSSVKTTRLFRTNISLKEPAFHLTEPVG